MHPLDLFVESIVFEAVASSTRQAAPSLDQVGMSGKMFPG
jgi:hypothetical protein